MNIQIVLRAPNFELRSWSQLLKYFSFQTHLKIPISTHICKDMIYGAKLKFE